MTTIDLITIRKVCRFTRKWGNIFKTFEDQLSKTTIATNSDEIHHENGIFRTDIQGIHYISENGIAWRRYIPDVVVRNAISFLDFHREKIVLSGSFILKVLLGEQWKSNDIDIFYESEIFHRMICDRYRGHLTHQEYTYDTLMFHMMGVDVQTCTTEPLQFIKCNNMRSFISDFDFDCVKLLYDGKSLEILPGAYNRIITRNIIIDGRDKEYMEKLRPVRLEKYAKRGFSFDIIGHHIRLFGSHNLVKGQSPVRDLDIENSIPDRLMNVNTKLFYEVLERFYNTLPSYIREDFEDFNDYFWQILKWNVDGYSFWSWNSIVHVLFEPFSYRSSLLRFDHENRCQLYGFWDKLFWRYRESDLYLNNEYEDALLTYIYIDVFKIEGERSIFDKKYNRYYHICHGCIHQLNRMSPGSDIMISRCLKYMFSSEIKNILRYESHRCSSRGSEWDVRRTAGILFADFITPLYLEVDCKKYEEKKISIAHLIKITKGNALVDNKESHRYLRLKEKKSILFD